LAITSFTQLGQKISSTQSLGGGSKIDPPVPEVKDKKDKEE